MIAACRFFSIGLLLLTASGAAAAPAENAPTTEATPDRYEALIKRLPMIFFVAKGGPDSCGPGCSEWIAAEGAIDAAAAQRFREFLAGLPRRDLPVFFSSIGGSIGQALHLAEALRENRMAVAVGRTIPNGCAKAAVDEACRRVMQSKLEHQARLITKDARCVSACVYALLGGSHRKVAQDAKLGIHSARLARGQTLSVEDSHNLTRGYIVELGIDPGLIDAAAKISADRVHIMRREEIARFGVESSEFETRWLAHKGGRAWYVSKSITQANPSGTSGHRTSTIRFACNDVSGVTNLVLLYRRELLANETEPPRIYISVGEAFWFMQAGAPTKAAQIVQTKVTFDVAKRAVAKPALEIVEWFSVQGEKRTRKINISTDGLSEALGELQNRCGDQSHKNLTKPVQENLTKPAQATAR